MRTPKGVRLDKLICEKTPHTRREAHKLIREGKVLVNGQRALGFDQPISRVQDVVCLCGKNLPLEQYVYLMLHKPKGYVCATEDKLLPTVMELIPQTLQCKGLFPAGRLDKDTTGFLLLTNHGELAHGLLSPRSHVEKEYQVATDKPLTNAVAEAFAQGILLPPATRRERDKLSQASSRPIVCQPAQLILDEDNPCTARVILKQGMFHQIKRMFEANGVRVTGLHRLRMGNVLLDETLPLGAVRPLTAAEIQSLHHAATVGSADNTADDTADEGAAL